ncbi:DsbA family protein [Dongia sp.]|uniref:DsbA family protein n=1 Tax=Dongia sp. TaxID=1977262 RepID=UPI0035AF6203
MRHLPKFAAAAFLLCLVVIGGMATRAQEASFDPAQKQAIEEIVRAYLLENPEVIKEAIQALQAKEQAAEANQQAGALAANKDSLFADPLAPIAGNPIGDATIVEFFDYKCPYCKRVTPALADLLAEDKGVRIVFKEFPILGESSVVAARAALAAVKQDRYLDIHNALMAHRGDFDEAAITAIATELGLDVERLKADMKAPEIDQQLKANHELALTLGIRSTPTFVIGDQIVPGAMSIDDMKALIADFRGGS